ncbi:unnamed protein product [Lactuca saligna]|uniref:Uncharacterized protein n=1 Tax=Lactuca saligna TaxID=75948 RepID=A0AA35Z435_LACSI|nr:unnamed protein product [Lactuca saligna]
MIENLEKETKIVVPLVILNRIGDLQDSIMKGDSSRSSCGVPLLNDSVIGFEDEELPSSSQLLDDNPDCQLSSSIEEGKPNVEENNEKDDYLVPDTALEISSTNIESLVAKLMKEVEVLKGSHLKQITDINMLEQ